jgi:hypothetical protein
MLKTLTSLAIVLAAGAAQAQGYNYGSHFDNAPGLTGAPGLYAPGLGQRFDQDDPYGSQRSRNSYDSYDPVPRLSKPSDDDYGYHPRDSYDWHHGYDRGE